MVRTFDVFRVQTEGGVRWLGTVESIEAAKALIKVESAKQPGDFLVVNEAQPLHVAGGGAAGGQGIGKGVEDPGPAFFVLMA